MKMKLAIALMTLLLPQSLHAQVGDECVVQFSAGTQDPAWLSRFDTCNEEMRFFVQNYVAGIGFYGSALEELSHKTRIEQQEIMEIVYSDVLIADDLIRDLRLPLSLVVKILEEAQKNGADEFWDLPAFEESLLEFREHGYTGKDTMDDIILVSGGFGGLIYINQASEVMQARLVAAEERLADAQERLADEQGRLVDAQERLADEQGRLVDAQERLADEQGRLVDAQERLADEQGRLADLKEIEEQLDEILELLSTD